MRTVLTIEKIGNSAVLVLPEELLAHLGAEVGDTFYVTEAPGGLHLTAADPGLAARLDAVEAIIREDRDILRDLAQ